MDSWVRYEGQVKQRQQRELAEAVISKIEKELENPRVLKQILDQSVADVERKIITCFYCVQKANVRFRYCVCEVIVLKLYFSRLRVFFRITVYVSESATQANPITRPVVSVYMKHLDDARPAKLFIDFWDREMPLMTLKRKAKP